VRDLPDAEALLGFVKAAEKAGTPADSILAAVNAGLPDEEKLGAVDKLVDYSDMSILRDTISRVAKEKGWFKTLGRGETLGDFVFGSTFTRMTGTDFRNKLKAMEEWVLAR